MRQRWLSRRALLLHLVVLIVVPLFLRLCVWQIDRATSGNELSWAYVFEWPFFAGYALYLWWKLIHDESNNTIGEVREIRDVREDADHNDQLLDRSVVDREEEELAAYNRYLSELNDSTRSEH
ncbi:MAG: hypothetical protein M1134_00295 [Actinobacteria bacterium]|nr:hypothetical protein [Actinomycetota bacterium]MCL5445341.1 hypothetical protein [Actinomycetota bacterium]